MRLRHKLTLIPPILGLMLFMALPVYAFCIGSSSVTVTDPASLEVISYSSPCESGDIAKREWYKGGSGYIYCNGDNWLVTNESGTDGSCSGESTLQYDTVNKRYEVCDGSNWVPITSAGTLGACASDGQIEYDTTLDVLKWCDSSDFQSMGKQALGILSPKETNLVGHWDFDDGTGSGSAADQTSNGNDGTLMNMASASDWVGGKIGEALDFDGTDDYVSIPDDASLDITSSITVAAWVYGRDWSNNTINNILAKRDFSGGERVNYQLSVRSNGVPLFYFDTLGDIGDINATTSLDEDVWYHVAATYDGANLRIFVNGTLENTVAETDAMVANSNQLSIGRIVRDSAGDFAELDGQIDDVRIYDTALTNAEIQVLYLSTQKIATAEGLIGHWKFDDLSGSGTALDDGTGGTDGTLNNMDSATDWVDGFVDGALDFDGTNDHVDLGDLASIDFSNSYSISLWTKLDQFGDPDSSCGDERAVLFAKERTASSHGITLLHQPATTNRFHFRHQASDFTSYSAIDPDQDRSTDRWYHVVAMYDDSDDELRLYLDGVLIDTGDTTGKTMLNPDGDAYIGGETKNCSADYTDGQIDDVRVYDRALSASEIQQLYYQTGGELPVTAPTAPTSGLVGHWKLDEATGTTATDDGSAGEDGTLVNFPASPDWVNGNIDGALDFFGSNKRITIPANAAFSVVDMTLAGWFYYPDAPSGNFESIVQHNRNGANDYGIWYNGPLGLMHFRWDVGWSGNVDTNMYMNATTTITAGQWYHVVGTFDSSTSTARIYINGQVENERTTATPGTANLSAVRIGEDTSGASDFTGFIDDVRIYNRALTEQEVSDLYFATGGELYEGFVCADGSVYAGVSPDGDAKMFATPCDHGQIWNGSACTSSRSNLFWNNGNLSGYTTTGTTDLNDGDGNTAAIITFDADNVTGGNQQHQAAQSCVDLNAHSHTDWYLPAQGELTVMEANKVAIGNFDTAQVDGLKYWSSSEHGTNSIARAVFMTDGTLSTNSKQWANNNHRCIRQDPCDAAAPEIGAVCADGTVYAGTSEYGLKMFATRCDYGQTWDGSSCTGSRDNARWNNSGNVIATDTGLTDRDTGLNNTNALATVADADDDTGAFEAHQAAEDCYNLVRNGYSDWYLPALDELGLLHAEKQAIGNFLTDGTDYWSSTDRDAGLARARDFSSGATANRNKSTGLPLRCVRRGDPCDDSPTIGDVCNDGTVYAGVSPDGSVPMYTTRCDLDETWDGAACTGTSFEDSWDESGFSTDEGTDETDGDGNTAILAVIANDYLPAKGCHDLVQDGHNDWYLPSLDEMQVVEDSYVALGNFIATEGYWTSSEVTGDEDVNAYAVEINNASPIEETKTGGNIYFVRCVRK